MISSDRDSPLSPELVASMSLEDALRALGLEHAAASLEAAQQKAIARNGSPVSLLDHLIREELRSQIEKRAKSALKRAAIFPLTTIDTYDFSYPKQIDRALVNKAATLHLANALGQLACLRGFRVRFVLAADLVNELVASQARNTLARRLAAWAAPDLLLIDELGYLAFDARGADLLYQVINRRYQRASTVITTNLPFKDWGKLFHNTAAASAIADRLVHRGILVRIAGKSKRSDEEVE
jgi:DNA replication protein DnaC